MKRNEFVQIKALSMKELAIKAKDLRKQIADLFIDFNMKKLKDTKSVFRKRKDLAQVLTVLKQKELLEQLETKESDELKESK